MSIEDGGMVLPSLSSVQSSIHGEMAMEISWRRITGDLDGRTAPFHYFMMSFLSYSVKLKIF